MKKTQTDEKTVKTWDEVEVLATEVIGQARKQTKRWMMAFLVALALLIGSNVAWAYAYTTAVGVAFFLAGYRESGGYF